MKQVPMLHLLKMQSLNKLNTLIIVNTPVSKRQGYFFELYLIDNYRNFPLLRFIIGAPLFLKLLGVYLNSENHFLHLSHHSVIPRNSAFLEIYRRIFFN